MTNRKMITDFFIGNGQYRHDIAEYEGSPVSVIAYPVFDSFSEDRKVAGALLTNVSPIVTLMKLSHQLHQDILARVLCRRAASKF